MDVNIYIPDIDDSGTKIITSNSSKFSAIRVKRSVSSYPKELSNTGLYFLLVGNDSVYVGESGLDIISKRIMKTHTGNIDSSWHTVIGFPFSGSIGKNELYYLENALCEYTYSHYSHCLTTTPAKVNCNVQYRDTHYQLTTAQINACKQYFKEITTFIKAFGSSIFPDGLCIAPSTTTNQSSGVSIVGSATTISTVPLASNSQVMEFYFKSPKRDSDGKAEIIIHCGNTNKRKTILKAGSKVSKDVSVSFKGHDGIVAHRKKLEIQGILVNRVLQPDVTFSSQSGAGQFLNGVSFDGNSRWKNANGVPLKNLLV